MDPCGRALLIYCSVLCCRPNQINFAFLFLACVVFCFFVFFSLGAPSMKTTVPNEFERPFDNGQRDWGFKSHKPRPITLP